MSGSILWKDEIVKLVYIKQALADADKKHLYPHHLPKVAASPHQVHECEEALGFQLDGEHRQFLLHANGWDGFVQTTCLFGTDDFCGCERFKEAQELLDVYDSGVFDRAGIPREGFFPIAASSVDRDLFAMVKRNVSSAARVFWFAGYEIDHYPSFSEFFFSMMHYNRLGIERLQRA